MGNSFMGNGVGLVWGEDSDPRSSEKSLEDWVHRSKITIPTMVIDNDQNKRIGRARS